MSDATDLVAVDTLKAADVFSPGGVEKLLLKVAADVRAHRMDSSTDKGRAEIRSLAYKVARSKTALDEMGKEFVAELKRAAATIDADRRTIRDRLDALRDEVRKPVDEWEAAEEARVAGHVAALDAIKAAGEFQMAEPTIADLDARLATVTAARTRDWQEFSERATQLGDKVLVALTALRETAVRRESERAELEQLRKAEADRAETQRREQVAREQRERDETIAAEAAAKAKREADERAAVEQRRVEQEKVAAIARAEKAEADAKAAAEKAEQDRKRAAEQADRDRAAAVEAERKRVADAKSAEAAETARREADRNHRSEINKAALADLVTVAGLTEAQAKAVVVAIAVGKIANVKIHY